MKHILIVTSLFVLGVGLCLGSFVQAQTPEVDDNLAQLSQKPVAVDKLVAVTGNPDAVQELAHSLNDGDIDASNFNQTISGAAQTGSLKGITEVRNFVSGQIDDGLQGKELAESIHQHLNEAYGIPAGRAGVEGTPPIAQEFIPAQAQEQLHNERQERRPGAPEMQRPGSANRPNSTGGPSGQSGPTANSGGRP